RHGSERSQDGCRARRNEGEAEADKGGFEQRCIVDQLGVPVRRPAAPYRDETRCVERVDHQNDDRQIKECDAEQDRGEIECGDFSHRQPRSAARIAWYWKTMMGVTNRQTSATATAAAVGQSLLPKNSIQIVCPIIGVCEPPSRSAMTNSPTAGMKHSRTPAKTPGHDSGNVTSQNT